MHLTLQQAGRKSWKVTHAQSHEPPLWSTNSSSWETAHKQFTGSVQTQRSIQKKHSNQKHNLFQKSKRQKTGKTSSQVGKKFRREERKVKSVCWKEDPSRKFTVKHCKRSEVTELSLNIRKRTAKDWQDRKAMTLLIFYSYINNIKWHSNLNALWNTQFHSLYLTVYDRCTRIIWHFWCLFSLKTVYLKYLLYL